MHWCHFILPSDCKLTMMCDITGAPPSQMSADCISAVCLLDQVNILELM